MNILKLKKNPEISAEKKTKKNLKFKIGKKKCFSSIKKYLVFFPKCDENFKFRRNKTDFFLLFEKC